MKNNTMRFLVSTFLFALLLFGQNSHAQHPISGTIKDYQQKILTLNQLRGDIKTPIDSVTSDSDGHFSFTLSKNQEAGMYLISIEGGNAIRIIYNNEEIRFVSAGVDDESMVDFVVSKENKLWYAYYFLKTETQYKQDLIKPILQQYPEDSKFYDQTKDEYSALQQSLHKKANEIIAANPNTLAARYIKTDLSPIIDLKLSFAEQRAALKKSFFDGTDFTDTLLINSDILSRKMIDFLSLHQRPNMSMQEAQIEFIKALDIILEKASVQNKMYLFVIDFFIDGFNRMGLTAVSDYLSTLPHLNSDCIDTKTLLEIEEVVGPYRKILIGSPAPEIISKDINGNEFNLNELKSQRTILLFWSLTCPHCLDLIPQLKQFAMEHPEIEVVSIVMSPNNQILKDFIAQEQLNWTHIADGKSWDSPFVSSYVVYGTPTLFLLDQDKKIIAKPSGMGELKAIYKLK